MGRQLAAIAGTYDAAQTGTDNRNHWAAADLLSANAANSVAVLQTLRARARYEVANNSIARGMVNTLANYIVGTGPRLQSLIEGDAAANRRVEREFSRWADEISLAEKLWTMRVSQAESGEAFALLATNPNLDSPVKLDVRLFEADQVATPYMAARQTFEPNGVDGIEFDERGYPKAYHLLRRHPGDAAGVGVGGRLFDTVPASSMIHLFRVERPGQARGLPEIMAALPLFALLRRYTLAVLHAAENAALASGVIQTDAAALQEIDEVDPLDEVDLDRGTWLTMPAGWKISQLRAEQPVSTYREFKREILNEAARCLNMPFNVAAGNSEGYNYASGRLDHQSFHRFVRIDQRSTERRVLNRVFRAFIDEASLISGYLPQAARTIERPDHQWFWDGLEHVDPAKEANAQETRLRSGTTTLAAECARQGRDWEEDLRQRGREVALARELGLPIPGLNAPAPEAEPETEESEA